MVAAVVLMLLAYNEPGCAWASKAKRPPDISHRVRTIPFRGSAGDTPEVNRFTPSHFEEAR